MAIECLTDANFRARIEASPRAVLCVGARWCGLSLIFAPRYARLSAELTHVRFFSCDRESQPACAASVPLESLPYFALYEAGRRVGGISTTDERALRALIETRFGRPPAE